MGQTVGHMREHGHILKHTVTFVTMYQTIGHIEAYSHIEPHEFTMGNQHGRL